MRMSTLFGAKNIGFFEIYRVRTRGKGVNFVWTSMDGQLLLDVFVTKLCVLLFFILAVAGQG